MLSAVTPNTGIYPSKEQSNLFESLMQEKTASEIIKNRQELVDGFASRFFRRTVEEGLITGPDGRPLKLSPEQMEAWLAGYKKDLLDHLLTIEADKLEESSEKKLANAAMLKESSEKKLAEAQRKFAQAEKYRQEGLTEQFWAIFNGKAPLAKEMYNEVFNTYLADRSLTVEKIDGTSCGRINSWDSIIEYIKAHPLTKTCDFRSFRKEVSEVTPFADFLKTEDAFGIKGVAFKSCISERDKEKLVEAVKTRALANSALKVQYFD